ncbi:hypothetical protein L1049_017432 [Liquidambar formosana]|uniref:J domain-containing protein n=1 Tax=Liquidambar formosana TaxID=63359 RepID=A0AAP0S7Y4_LIQFO
MGKVGGESDFKSQLVIDICSISTRPTTCSHRRRGSPSKSHFVDWYRLLQVEEDADADIIRRQYLKLALQLHPDKNKHPKAETAFKLVSEAFGCLSDNVKRRAFDLERRKNFCIECNKIPFKTCNPPTSSIAAKLNGLNPADRSRSSKILRGLKGIRDRFKEEARVIENCLRATAASGKESPLFNHPSDCLFKGSYFNQGTRKESPIFNPSDYLFPGYPHLRTRIYKKPENLWYLQTGNTQNYEHGRAKYDYPVFEIRSERRPFKSKNTCLYS